MPAPIKVMFQAAIRDARLSATTKLVGLVLSTYMGPDGIAFPSVTAVARGACCSQNTARRALHELGEIGLVTISQRPGRRSTYLADPSHPGGRGGEDDPSHQDGSPPSHSYGSPPSHPGGRRRGTEGFTEGVDAANGYGDPAAAELARAAARDARRLLGVRDREASS